MRRPVTAALFAMSLVVPALALAASPSEDDLRQAAVQLGKEYDEAYNSKSASGMASLYTQNGTLVPPGRPPVEGRQAITVYYQGRFDAGATGHLTKIDEVHALGDGGFGIGEFTVTARGPDGAPHQFHGNTVYFYEHTPDGWKYRLVTAGVVPNR
jgi:ketosteroid isomerase-like protein